MKWAKIKKLPSTSLDVSVENMLRVVSYSTDWRIQAVTDWPVRCLKARLKVL